MSPSEWIDSSRMSGRWLIYSVNNKSTNVDQCTPLYDNDNDNDDNDNILFHHNLQIEITIYNSLEKTNYK